MDVDDPESDSRRHAISPVVDSNDEPSHTQDAGDFGVGSMSLGSSAPTPEISCDGGQSKNPFRRKHPAPDALASPGGASTYWDETIESPPTMLQDGAVRSDRASGSSLRAHEHTMSSELPTHSQANGRAPLPRGVGRLADATLSEAATPTPLGEEPSERGSKQESEVYQIKHIRWHDVHSKENPRSSPILLQNANGPCPLLALVNALSLSTPAEVITPFIDAIRTREQISLELLLSAVFEELMSERRIGDSPDLPDVGELYAFLIALHTGMNVNPRFVPAADSTIGGSPIGTFDETREMTLYNAFQIPLIHGWIPHKQELAYQAFLRNAQTYEDAQNIQFREDDLEQKLEAGGMSDEEQSLLNDITTVKQFLAYWPTQLTVHGLDAIKRFVQPGQTCILFRNDHFSMIYKEPISGKMMTLVTDAGYATHDEIVWESFEDISGSSNEWYSGDFRSVSHDAPTEVSCAGDDGWTTVQSRRTQHRKATSDIPKDSDITTIGYSKNDPDLHNSGPDADATPQSGASGSGRRARTASEREDLDLAIALQLQEEEEERHRNEVAKRRAQENQRSQDYINRQPSNTRGAIQIPPRRNGLPTQAASSEPHNRVSGEDAPPSYHEAWHSQPYHPPRDHPSNEHAPRAQASAQIQRSTASRQGNLVPSSRRRTSAQQALAAQMASGQTTGPTRRQARIETGMNSANGGKDGDKCILM